MTFLTLVNKFRALKLTIYIQNLLVQYLKSEGYSIPFQNLKERLFSDPDNEVLAITNTLDFFNIENIVANVPKSSLSELPDIFLAELNDNGQSRLALIAKKDNKIKVTVDKGKAIVLSITEFTQKWSGLIIAIEKNKIKNYIDFKISLPKIVFGLLLFLSIAYISLFESNFHRVLIFLLSLFGLLLSAFVIYEKLGINSFVSRFCSFSKKSSCSSVANSKSSKLFSIIDVSDVCIVYFSFLIMSQLFVPYVGLTSVLILLSPIGIIYSLYHQYFTIKKWCPLCLGIASVLIIQFVLNFFFIKVNFDFDILMQSLLLELIIMSALTVSWSYIKSLLVSTIEKNDLRIENLKFRRNHHLFIPYYRELKAMDVSMGTGDIVLGSHNPKVVITAVLSPSCKYCGEAFSNIKKKLEINSNSLQVNVRLLVSSSNTTDNFKVHMAERLLQLFFEEGEATFMTALEDWYSIANVKIWFQKWQRVTNSKYSEVLNKHHKWCQTNHITSSPTIFINGRLIPRIYDSKDIVNFIGPLLEIEKQQTERDSDKIMHAETQP